MRLLIWKCRSSHCVSVRSILYKWNLKVTKFEWFCSLKWNVSDHQWLSLDEVSKPLTDRVIDHVSKLRWFRWSTALLGRPCWWCHSVCLFVVPLVFEISIDSSIRGKVDQLFHRVPSAAGGFDQWVTAADSAHLAFEPAAPYPSELCRSTYFVLTWSQSRVIKFLQFFNVCVEYWLRNKSGNNQTKWANGDLVIDNWFICLID